MVWKTNGLEESHRIFSQATDYWRMFQNGKNSGVRVARVTVSCFSLCIFLLSEIHWAILETQSKSLYDFFQTQGTRYKVTRFLATLPTGFCPVLWVGHWVVAAFLSQTRPWGLLCALSPSSFSASAWDAFTGTHGATSPYFFTEDFNILFFTVNLTKRELFSDILDTFILSLQL